MAEVISRGDGAKSGVLSLELLEAVEEVSRVSNGSFVKVLR